MSSSTINRDRINEIIYQLQLYEAHAKNLNEQLNLVQLKLSELQSAKEALENISKMSKGQEVLLPIGGGVYFKSSIIDTQNVFLDLGANVIAVKTTVDALEIINKNIASLTEAKNKLEKQISDVLNKSRQLQEALRKLSQTAKT
ncbi:MAG: prefoldin subunit alpha [Candidatus Asgardarchaeia archaeon]